MRAGRFGHLALGPHDHSEFHTILAVSSRAISRQTAAAHSLSAQARHGVGGRHEFPLPAGTPFHLDLALDKASWPHENLPRNADQVGGSEFRAGPLVEIVVE